VFLGGWRRFAVIVEKEGKFDRYLVYGFDVKQVTEAMSSKGKVRLVVDIGNVGWGEIDWQYLEKQARGEEDAN